MKVEEFGAQITQFLRSIRINATGKTYLHTTGKEILEMAEAYASDGWQFFATGDRVNAHASFAYGWGWLNTGICLGFLSGPTEMTPLPSFEENIDRTNRGKLQEKTERYRDLLNLARHSLIYAPETDTAAYKAADDIFLQCKRDYEKGVAFLQEDSLYNALALFSYGHALLDCGVRAGLFRITGEREIFTI